MRHYSKASELATLVNQLTEEHVRLDSDTSSPFKGESWVEPTLEMYARKVRQVLEDNPTVEYPGKRCDAGEDVFIARQLIFMQAKQVNQLYLATKALSYVPVDTSVPAGAETFTTLSWTQIGKAAFVANYGTDFPDADAFVTETTNKMYDIGSAFRYSIRDLRRAAFGGVPLEAKRAEASRFAHEAFIDELALSGNAQRSLTGLANNTGVTLLTAGGGTVVGAWESASAATIKADLAAIESTMLFANPDQPQLMGDTLLLDDESYMILNTRPATSFSDRTILSSYLENSPYIKNIEPWVKLRNAGAAGVRRAVMYKRNPDVLDMKISQNYETFAPIQEGLSWKVPAMSRVSGVIVYRTSGLCYVDGLSASLPAGL